MAIRTQIYLPEELYQRVKARTTATGKSMAQQIRESLERYLDEIEAGVPKPGDSIWKLAGSVQGNDHDLSTNHDLYLYGKDKKH